MHKLAYRVSQDSHLQLDGPSHGCNYGQVYFDRLTLLRAISCNRWFSAGLETNLD